MNERRRLEQIRAYWQASRGCVRFKAFQTTTRARPDLRADVGRAPQNNGEVAGGLPRRAEALSEDDRRTDFRSDTPPAMGLAGSVTRV